MVEGLLLLICVILAIWVGRQFTVREEKESPQHDWGDADVRNDNFYHGDRSS